MSEEELGPAWTDTFTGDGSGVMRTRGWGVGWQQVSDYQSVNVKLDKPPTPPKLPQELLHCTGCTTRFQAGDCLTAELATDMGGTWRHTDCDDPKLENTGGNE